MPPGYPPYGGYGQPGYGPPGYGPPGYGQPGGYWQAPKPGIIPLRPVGVGEILNGAFTSIRLNPKATLGLAAILMVISGVVSGAVSIIAVHGLHQLNLQPGQQLTGAQVRHVFAYLLPTYLVSALLAFLVAEILTGMLTAVVGRSVLGQKLSIGGAWRTALPRLPAIIGATVLYGLIIAGCLIVYGAIGLLLVVAHIPAGGYITYFVLGFFAMACAVVWLGVSFCLSVPVVVLERQGPVRALARSWRLVRGTWWRVFGIVLLGLLIVAAAGFVIEIPFELAGAATGFRSLSSPGSVSLAGTVIATVGSVIAGAVTRPVAAGVTVLLYVDLRMRKEGLDLVLQTAARNQYAEGEEFAAAWRPPSSGQM